MYNKMLVPSTEMLFNKKKIILVKKQAFYYES